MASNSSYNNDKVVTGEVEYPANDPASGAFFQPDYKRNEDLKLMLDGSKDSLKLEAMKRIIGMIAKGRNASDLFPAVVKNVVSKNIEVKKLVYVYLVRYAEEQQDLALLSISTFQRALKDPNQLIRASALRVLSSIRVNMIVPIVMLAIKDSASDMSAYVRKTAAHAIPKLYSLDPDQKEELVNIIDKLLSDKAPLVVGSAAMAFMEVCPERMTLIHKSYRKLCLLLVDVDEWGQLVLLNMLTIYAKTFFPNPNNDVDSVESDGDRPFYEDSDSDSSATGDGETKKKQRRSAVSPTLDPDHKMLLRAARPLLQSRNAGVVMAVAQFYYHCGPAQDLPPVAKAMIRLLRAPLEVQSVVLHAIASLTISKRSLFEPFLKSFFVRMSDPTHIKLLKLEILTNLATEASAPVVLREFQTYVTSNDKTFAGATIQAIGRLASNIDTVTETCLNGLLHLLSSKDEWVVCEAVVVVKRVVGGGASSARAAVSRAAKLLRSDRLAANARAAAVWLVAEHGVTHPRAASILAHMATDFPEQDELVKLQLLTLAVKLTITQPDTLPLSRYVLTLARYDPSYDVRDRARLLKRFVDPEDKEKSQIAKHAALIFLAQKPAPVMESKFKDRQQYTLGTLSHYVGNKANGYIPLPSSPTTVLEAHLREYVPSYVPVVESTPAEKRRKDKTLYSEPGSSGSNSSTESSSSDSSSSDDTSNEEESEKGKKDKDTNVNRSNNYRSSSSSADSESDSDTSSSEESDSDTSVDRPDNKRDPKPAPEPARKPEKSNLELLLELDEVSGGLPTMTPTCGGLLSPNTTLPGAVGADDIQPASPYFVSATGVELLSRVVTGGLSCVRRWSRAPHLYSPNMLAIELSFTNHTTDDITNIRLNKKTLTGSRTIHEFALIPSLGPGASASSTLGVDFSDTIQPVEFTIMSSLGEVTASITPPVGELMRAVSMSEGRWELEQKKLRGMTECDKKAPLIGDDKVICQRVYETANMAAVTTTGSVLRFSARLMSSRDLVLVAVLLEDSSIRVTVNCPNMAIASMLANEIGHAFGR